VFLISLISFAFSCISGSSITKEREKLPEIIKDTQQAIVLTKEDEQKWKEVGDNQLDDLDSELKNDVPISNEEKEVSKTELCNIGRLFGLNMMIMKTADNVYTKRRRDGVKTLTERLMERKEEVLESYLGVIRKYPNSFIINLLCDPVGNLALSNFMIFEEFKLENGKI